MSVPSPIPPPPDPTPAAIPWYKSNILRSLVAIAVTHTLVHYNLVSQFTPADVGDFVNGLLSAIGYGATAFAAYSRVAHPTPPIVSSKAKADATVIPVQPPEKTP